MKMTKEERDARKVKQDAAKEINRIRSGLETDRKDTAAYNIPTPTRFYKVGDRVRYGNWDWSSILEVCDGGKYYKLVIVTRHTNRNVKDYSELKIQYLAWYEFVSYKSPAEINQLERLEEDEDIHFYYSQRDIFSLMSIYFQKYGIDLEPEYQRGNVWTLEQKVDLINSIFHNVDIGKFAVIKRPWGSNKKKPLTPKLYEMLDGKQRLTAIIEYYTGQFAYKGKYYDDLHPRDKHHFKYYSVSEAETAPLTKEQKYRYFLKLNTTGTPVCEIHMERVRGLLQNEIDSNPI